MSDITLTREQAATAEKTSLYHGIRDVLLTARKQARQAINDTMVQAYWHVGRLIVEDEQGGQARAEYGKGVLEDLSRRLTSEFGKGFTAANLRNFRQFYFSFTREEICDTVCSKLTWSHFRLLMRVEQVEARTWYANEAASQGWSVRALDRQIGTLFYERLLSSRDKEGVLAEADVLIAQQAPADPRDFIRDPYVLEFLGARADAGLYEQELEQGLLNQLQQFLMELGKGFAFVARQKHLRVEGEDCYVDLVFYNYLLKCFVLIELLCGRPHNNSYVAHTVMWRRPAIRRHVRPLVWKNAT